MAQLSIYTCCSCQSPLLCGPLVCARMIAHAVGTRAGATAATFGFDRLSPWSTRTPHTRKPRRLGRPQIHAHHQYQVRTLACRRQAAAKSLLSSSVFPFSIPLVPWFANSALPGATKPISRDNKPPPAATTSTTALNDVPSLLWPSTTTTTTNNTAVCPNLLPQQHASRGAPFP